MSFPVGNDPHQWLTFVPESLKASPLYMTLWESLQHDTELLVLMNLVDTNQPLPITFFTAVNFLVLKAPDHPLAWYYPYLHQGAAPPLAEAYQLFREFVLAHHEILRSLLPTARLQTNEVTRCSNLLPAFFLAYQRGEEKPLNMIEIGSSAGFNLLWDLYYYKYESNLIPQHRTIGEESAPVHIRCTVDGVFFPPLPETFPRVSLCQGIELVPRESHNDEDMRWIRAAIWPEERARYHLLDTVIRFVQQTPIRLRRGDACEHLPTLLAAIPASQTALIWHSFAVNQGPIQVKDQLEQQILAASCERTIYRVSLEVFDRTGPKLELLTYEQGKCVKQEYLANCAFHGERMTWLAIP